MSESEPFDEASKREDDVKTRSLGLVWDEFEGCLSVARSASGVEAA